MKYCRFTSLGDSITNGFTNYFFDGFTNYICEFLIHKGIKVKFDNCGKSGLTSKGLLHLIQCTPNLRCLLKQSDIITITIGGNNLLKCSCDNYRKIDKCSAQKGVEQFRKDWPLIMKEIRQHTCSSTEIYVMTLYNPYSPKDCNYDLAEYYISQINGIITSCYLISCFDYTVVDVHHCFKTGDGSCWTFFNNPLECIFRDPHPNSEGHRQIARTFIKSINNC